MAKTNISSDDFTVCINETLTDDELRSILSRLQSKKDKGVFALVCKRWFQLQSSEQKKLCICMRESLLNLSRLAARFSRLIELDLSIVYDGVTDSDLAIVAARLGYLRVLNLKKCKRVTDGGMISLGNGLPSLQALDVSYCRELTDTGLTTIAKGCHSLKSLHLTGCKSVTDGLLEALSKNCSHLEELGLEGCITVTNSGLSVLVDKCRQISFLDLNKCSKIGDVGVLQVALCCSSSLKTLKLLNCYKVGKESMFSLAKSCKNLETLVIGGCRYVSDESIISLSLACNCSLKKMRMDRCPNISDSSVSFILSHCKNLEALDIGCCREISDVAFRGLETGGFESSLSLKVLKANNCKRITVSGIAVLLELCKSLEYLDVRSCPNVSKAGCDQAGLQFPECCKVIFADSLLEMDELADVFGELS